MPVTGKAHRGAFIPQDWGIIGCIVLCLAGCKGRSETEPVEPRRPLAVKRQAVPAVQPGNLEEAAIEERSTGPVRNPFLSPEEVQALSRRTGRERLTSVHVAAIFYAPPASKAIVAGRVVAEGDVIDQKRIVQIQQEAVVLRDVADDQREYVAELEAVPGSGTPPPQDRR